MDLRVLPRDFELSVSALQRVRRGRKGSRLDAQLGAIGGGTIDHVFHGYIGLTIDGEDALRVTGASPYTRFPEDGLPPGSDGYPSEWPRSTDGFPYVMGPLVPVCFDGLRAIHLAGQGKTAGIELGQPHARQRIARVSREDDESVELVIRRTDGDMLVSRHIIETRALWDAWVSASDPIRLAILARVPLVIHHPRYGRWFADGASPPALFLDP